MRERWCWLTDSEYIKERLDDQIKWYSNKSSIFKRRHMIIEMYIIISAAIIPVLTLLHYYFGTNCLIIRHTDIIIAFLGVITAASAAYSKLNKLQENWLNYREVSETLKHEKYLYLANAGSYAQCENTFTLLVERCENIISHENLNWTQINRVQN